MSIGEPILSIPMSLPKQALFDEQSRNLATDLLGVIQEYRKYGLSSGEMFRIGGEVTLEKLATTISDVTTSTLSEGKYEAFIENLRSLLPYIYRKDSIKVANWYQAVMTTATRLYAHLGANKEFISEWYATRSYVSAVIFETLCHGDGEILTQIRNKKHANYVSYPRDKLEEAIILQIEKANKAVFASLKPTRAHAKRDTSLKQTRRKKKSEEFLDSDTLSLEYERGKIVNNTNINESDYLSRIVNAHGLKFNTSKARQESHHTIKQLIARKLELQQKGETEGKEYREVRTKLLDSLLLLIKKEVATFIKRREVIHLNFDDLFNEACIGALTAIEKHDGTSALSTYSTWWIRQSMERAYDDKERTIRVPIHRQDQINRLLKIDKALRNEGKSIFSIPVEEVKACMDEWYPKGKYSLDSIKEAFEIMTLRAVSDEVEADSDSDTTINLSDFVAFDDFEENEERFFNWIETQELLDVARKVCKDEHVEILIRHIIHGESPEQIAKKKGVTRERIRQIVEKVKRCIQVYLKNGVVVGKRRKEYSDALNSN